MQNGGRISQLGIYSTARADAFWLLSVEHFYSYHAWKLFTKLSFDSCRIVHE